MTSKTPNMAQRTDADIFTAARHALDQCRTVPGGVRVHVEHGIVTLTGSVQWPSESADAEAAVRNIAGVQRVENNLTVAHVASKEGFEPPEAE